MSDFWLFVAMFLFLPLECFDTMSVILLQSTTFLLKVLRYIITMSVFLLQATTFLLEPRRGFRRNQQVTIIIFWLLDVFRRDRQVTMFLFWLLDFFRRDRQFTQVTQSPFRLLDLPPELRLCILEHSMEPKKDIVVLVGQMDTQPAITKVCRRLREEGLYIYYKTTTFVVKGHLEGSQARQSLYQWHQCLNRVDPRYLQDLRLEEEAKQAILAFADSKILEQHTGFGTKELEIIDHALSTLQQALAGEPLP
ncbi:hypothetical protein M8818_003376 [Zalaria obscura]|uniref:Uncharacterized protein n=1 Tax=Zalaria obscura TaxID=2024903 RepID=A0ACC3SEY7_9PEZI